MTRGMKDGEAGKEPAEDITTQQAAWMATTQAATTAATAATTTPSTLPAAPRGKVGYASGYATGKYFHQQGTRLDWDLVAQGMNDVAMDKEIKLPPELVEQLIQSLTVEALSKAHAERTILMMDNRKAGLEFLAENKTKEGVVTLPSGLQYKILKAGDGPIPTKKDTVEVNYRGTLIDGTEFENTYTAKKPVTLNLSDGLVIVGLKEALQLMPVGSKWQLFLPSRLAYLWRGHGKLVGPEAALIYELELVSIKSEPAK